jgi:hypothetical protein
MTRSTHYYKQAPVRCYALGLVGRNVLGSKLTRLIGTQSIMNILGMALASGCGLTIFHSDQGYLFTFADIMAQRLTKAILINWSGRRQDCNSILFE